MPTSRLLQAAGILALTAALVFPAACSKKSPQTNVPDTGNPVVGGDTGPGDSDGGTPDADAGPVKCFYDDDCKDNERCLLPGIDTTDPNKANTCVEAMPCQDSESTCLDDSSTQYDYTYCIDNERNCRCVLSPLAKDKDPRMTGFCKRPRPACAPCTNDEQCGSTAFFSGNTRHNAANCIATSVDLPDTKYCLEKYDTLKCACGYNKTVDGDHFCSPMEAEGEPACSVVHEFICCTKDYTGGGAQGECPQAHPICEKTTGICKDSCHYDYEQKTTVGCPAGKVCNVDPKHLHESDLSFGSGRCAAPCTEDAQCAALAVGTPYLYRCLAETGSDKRCRPVGCLDDKECPNTAETAIYNSYCEKNSLACICDPDDPTGPCYCRGVREDGTDWLSPQGKVYKDDCKVGYKCSKGGDNKNTCIEKNCVDEGGAGVDCNFGEYCCGEDRNQNNNHNDDICNKDVAGEYLADYGKCYQAPMDIWCAACTANSDCQDPKFPVKTNPPFDQNMCYSGATDRCLLACDYRSQCPNGFGCSYIQDVCAKDATGTPDPAGCNSHPDKCTANCTQNPQDQTWTCFCACDTPYSTTECFTEGTRCANNGGYCVYGLYCIEKLVDPQAGTYLCDTLTPEDPAGEPDAGTP